MISFLAKWFALRTDKDRVTMRKVMQMKWVHTAAETVRQLSDMTKNLLVFCGSYMLLILFCAAACRICAGGLLSYYTARVLAADLFACIRPCVGITALGALLIEGSRVP